METPEPKDVSSASNERGFGTMGGRLRRATLLKRLGAGALLPLLSAGASERAEAAGQTYSFYLVSHNGPGNAFMEAESKGVAAAGRDLGVKTTFIGPKPGNETEQISMLRSAIAASPDGIAFSLYSPGPSTSLIKDAQSKGIALVLWNIQTLGTASPEEKGLAYVGQDEFTSGAKNAQQLLQYLKSGDTVLIATAFQGFPLSTRQSGATGVLKKAGHNVKFLFTGQDVVHGQGLVDAFGARNPDVKAFLTLDAVSATSVGKYLKASHQDSGKVPFSSFDLNPITLDYVQQGLLTFTLDQQPYVQGYMAMVDLYIAKKYGMKPVDINTGTLFIDRSNASSVAGLVKEGIGA